jgi:hypothetical protein
MKSIASTRLSEVLRPKSSGEPLNAHVIHLPPEPLPDYDAMNALISGDRKDELLSNEVKDAEDAERGKVPTLR